MKKIVFTFGGIAGLIMGAMFFITMPMYKAGTLNFDNGMWVGYTTMVIACSLTFFGIRAYRDQHLGGVISFGKAFTTGVLIALVASAIYVISWELVMRIYADDFMQSYSAHAIKVAESKGASAAEVAKLKTDMQQMAESYKNPFFRVGITFMEVFPVAALVALVCAAILRRKEVKAA